MRKNCLRKHIGQILSAQTLTALIGSSAWAWGAKGHEMVAEAGASLATRETQFWFANAANMADLSTVPDRVWKRQAQSRKGERATHWFQVDGYVSDANGLSAFPRAYPDALAQFGQDSVARNGTAPWRIQQFYRLALEALKNRDFHSALEFAGAMSHYVGDLSQPLHVAENYDGKETGDPGIHSFFESTNIRDVDEIEPRVIAQATRLVADQNFASRFAGSLMDAAIDEAGRAFAFQEQVTSVDNDLGRRGKGAAAQLKLAESRMADGAATLALILNRLWKESGLPSMATPTPVEDPEWVEPDYSEGFQARFASDSFGDDCDR